MMSAGHLSQPEVWIRRLVNYFLSALQVILWSFHPFAPPNGLLKKNHPWTSSADPQNLNPFVSPYH
jgi:hypothetical protein